MLEQQNLLSNARNLVDVWHLPRRCAAAALCRFFSHPGFVCATKHHAAEWRRDGCSLPKLDIDQLIPLYAQANRLRRATSTPLTLL